METQNFKDRKTLIIVAGVFELLLGLLFLGCSVLVLNAVIQTSQVSIVTMLPAVMIYLLLAAVFLTIAIGTFKIKTWARKIMLIFSISSLFMGCISLFQLAILDFSSLMPEMPAMPGAPFDRETFINAMKVFLLIFIAIFFVGVPLFFTLVLSGKNVKQTFLKYDKKHYWTDRVPMPILGLCFLFFMMALFTLPSLGIGAIMLFGKLFSGTIGMTILILFIVSHLLAGYLCYFQKPHAWKISLGITLFFTINFIISLYFVDMTEYYQIYIEKVPSAHVLSSTQYNDFWKNSHFMEITTFYATAYLLYLIWTRKFFKKEAR